MSEAQPTETPVNYKPIEGFPGHRVGDDGTVWSCWEVKRAPTGKSGFVIVLGSTWRQLKPWPTGFKKSRPGIPGAWAVNLGRRVVRTIHTLVLEAFVGPCPDGMEGCHFDGNPANNRLSNLRWDTPKANGADKIRHGTSIRGEGYVGSKLTDDAVRAMRADYASGNYSFETVAKKYNVSIMVAWKAIRRQTWKHVA